MERPGPATIAIYEKAVPDDPRAKKGQMFAHPCAFVNGNMFFGTFAQTIVARVGPERADALARGGNGRVFEPMPGTLWREYVQVPANGTPAKALAALATEALDWSANLKPKAATRRLSPKRRAPRKPR